MSATQRFYHSPHTGSMSSVCTRAIGCVEPIIQVDLSCSRLQREGRWPLSATSPCPSTQKELWCSQLYQDPWQEVRHPCPDDPCNLETHFDGLHKDMQARTIWRLSNQETLGYPSLRSVLHGPWCCLQTVVWCSLPDPLLMERELHKAPYYPCPKYGTN